MLAPTSTLTRSQAATPLFTPPPLIPWPKKYLSPKWWRRPSSWPLLFTPPAGPSPADTAVVNLRIYPPQKSARAAIQKRRHRPHHTAGPSPAEAAPAAAVASNTDEKSPVIQHRTRSPRTSRAPLQTTPTHSLLYSSRLAAQTLRTVVLHRPQISSRKQTRRRCSNGKDKRHKKRGTKRTKPKRKKNSLKPDVERRRARPQRLHRRAGPPAALAALLGRTGAGEDERAQVRQVVEPGHPGAGDRGAPEGEGGQARQRRYGVHCVVAHAG